MNHDLKCWADPFQAIVDGRKRFEIRKTEDRDYRVGDTLTLFEYDPVQKTYSGRWVRAMVTFLVEAQFGLPQKLCCMSLAEVEVGRSSVGKDGVSMLMKKTGGG